jgi:hypothetical protein
MITDYHDWSLDQHAAATRAFKAHEVRTQGHPLHTPGSFDRFLWKLAKGSIRAAFIDDYLVVYDMGETWCSAQNLLFEFIVLHTDLGVGGNFDTYTDGLIELARQNECYGVMTGNGVMRPGLRQQYLKRGFTPFNETYFKEA